MSASSSVCAPPTSCAGATSRPLASLTVVDGLGCEVLCSMRETAPIPILPVRSCYWGIGISSAP
jgi:hypothetical protein